MIKHYIRYEKAMCFLPTVPNIIKNMLNKKKLQITIVNRGKRKIQWDNNKWVK